MIFLADSRLARTRREGEILRETELLREIRQKLEQARALAAEIGGFNIYYMIDIALLETNELLYRNAAVQVEFRAAAAGQERKDH